MGTNLNSIKSLTRKFFLHKFAAAFTAVCIVFMCVPFAKLEVSAAFATSGSETLYFNDAADTSAGWYTDSGFTTPYETLADTPTTWGWNSGTSTLTLNGFSYTTTNTDGAIRFDQCTSINSININLIGENSLTVNSTGSGMRFKPSGTNRSIVFKGSGDLSIVCSGTGAMTSAIAADVNLDSSFTGELSVSGTSSDNLGTGVWGAVSVAGGSLVATGTSGASGINVSGIYGSLSMSGGSATVSALKTGGDITPKVITSNNTISPSVAYTYWAGSASDNCNIANGVKQAASTATGDISTAAYLKIDCAPALSSGTISRTSDTAATIGFTTTEGGTAYYYVVADGTTCPETTSWTGWTSLGSVSGTVTNQSVSLTEGVKDIWVAVADSGGNISTLKIDAAAYAAPSSDDTNDDDYSDADVAAIRALNISAFSGEPATWATTGNASVVWDTSSPKRITALDLHSGTLSGIFSLTASGTGLSELERLNVSVNSLLTYVTVSGFSKLKYLYLNDCDLSTATLSDLTAVRALDIGNNTDLTTLDLGDLTNLLALQIDSTGLTAINLSNNTELLSLYADGSSSLATINLTGLTKLGAIQARNCDLSSLDVSGCTNLGLAVSGIGDGYGNDSFGGAGMLDVSGNHLTSLNLTGLINLTSSNTTLTGQTATVELAGSDNNYSGSIDLGESATVTGTEISYSDGTLSSTNSSTTSAAFSNVSTGLVGVALSGTLTLNYSAALTALTGTASITVNPATGDLTASIAGGNNTGTLSYAWSGTGVTDSGTSTLDFDDYNYYYNVTVTITDSNHSGNITKTISVCNIRIDTIGATGYDSLSAVSYGANGETIDINYALDSTGTGTNTLTYGSMSQSATIASVSTEPGTDVSGTSTYTIDKRDDDSGYNTIIIHATFAHINTGTTEVLFGEVYPNGNNGTETTNALTLIFYPDITNLSVDNIVLTGATKGTLTAEEREGEYTLTISNITVNNGETINVAVSKSGYSITPSHRNVIVFKDVYTDVTYTAIQTGGTSGTVDSTGIQLTFSQAVTGLDIDDIYVTNGTGVVTVGTLSGSGTTYTIGLTAVTTAGDVTVYVDNFGTYDVQTTAQTVAVYKAAAAPSTYTVTFNSNGGTSVTQQSIANGNTATEPSPAPTLSGKTFQGWSTSNSTLTTYNFSTPVTETKTLYAFWKNNTPSATPTFDYTAEKITGLIAGDVYYINPTDYTANGSDEIDISSIIGSGEVQFIHKGNGTYILQSDPVNITIPGRPAAPTGLGKTDETSVSANDGTITGLSVTTAYQVSTNSGTSWTDKTSDGSGVITGLAPGTYKVRVKATDSAFASSNSADVTITAAVAPAKTVSVGTQSGTITAGTAGSATFTVTTANIDNAEYDVTVANLPTGVTVGNSSKVTISGNSGTLTLTGDTNTVAGSTATLTLTIDETTSAAFSLVIAAADPPPPTYTAVTGITGVPTTATTGLALTLSGTVAPAGATNTAIVWSVSNADAGTTNASIVGSSFTATTAGTATVTATIINGATENTDYTQDFTITVSDDAPIVIPVAVTGVTISGANTTTVGSVIYLTATVLPANADNKSIMWDSSNPGVATVSGGTVYAISEGITTITVTTVEGNFTDTLTITVTNPAPPPYNPPSTPSYPSYTPSYTPPAPVPTPAPPAPEPNPYVLPSMDVTETAEGTEFTTASGVTSTVQETPEGVKVEAGVNESGSINSQATAAAVSEAAQIAKENGETSVTIQIPEGATGLSKNTVQKLVEAAEGLEITLELTAIVDGEVVGGVTLPLTSETGQILTGLHFDTKRTEQIENYVTNKWDTDVLGSFETAQKGGWGATATLSIGLEKLGFSADDGTKLYALIYDTKAKKWYQAAAEVIDGEVVIKTKRTGIVTIVTDSVK